MSSEICEAAKRRYASAFRLFRQFAALTLVCAAAFVFFTGWVIIELMRHKPVSDQVVQLVLAIAAGGIGTFVANRFREAKADEQRAFEDMERACAPGIAESERNRLRRKILP